MNDTRIPGTDQPISAQYVQGYALGYYYGREHGNEDPGRDELARRHGPSTGENIPAYIGFDHGYSDGVEHYVEEEQGPCILTDENMHTADDCTLHDHERTT